MTAFPNKSQKQLSGNVLQNSCSEKIEQIPKKSVAMEYFCSLKSNKIHHHRCFLGNFLEFSRTAIVTLLSDSFCNLYRIMKDSYFLIINKINRSYFLLFLSVISVFREYFSFQMLSHKILTLPLIL